VASFSVAVVFAIPTTGVTEFASLVAGCAAVVAFNMLVAPHSPPGRLDPLTGTIATVTQYAAIAIVILNLLVLTVFFVAPGAFFWMFGVYLVSLSIGVATEYLQVGYVHRRNDEPTPPLPDDPELTVVVSAAFEADVLPESLRHNLETLGDVPFLVVPAVPPLRARRPSARCSSMRIYEFRWPGLSSFTRCTCSSWTPRRCGTSPESRSRKRAPGRGNPIESPWKPSRQRTAEPASTQPLSRRGGPTQTAPGWYSPNSSRMTLQISPTVA
jgi:hypothetical protein